jgi:hypothetical protein
MTNTFGAMQAILCLGVLTSCAIGKHWNAMDTLPGSIVSVFIPYSGYVLLDDSEIVWALVQPGGAVVAVGRRTAGDIRAMIEMRRLFRNTLADLQKAMDPGH